MVIAEDDGPTAWVPPGDSDDEGADDGGSSVVVQADMLEDPLLGHIERASAGGRRLLAARRQHGAAVDIRCESFDPLLYLAAVHQRTPLSQVELSADRLRAMAKKGGKVTSDSKKLIHANFGRFVAAQDKMLELRAALNADNGPQDVLDQLDQDLAKLEVTAARAYAPILSIQTQSAGLRTALSVLERHHSLFQLPALIKDDCAAGRFDRVVMTCSRAHEMLGAHPEGVLGRLREEVDTQIDAVCCSLRRRLADLSAPVSQLPDTIVNLSKLEHLQTRDTVAPKIRGFGSTAGNADTGGVLLACAQRCLHMQQEAVLASMARTVSNFHDAVSQIPSDEEISVLPSALPANSLQKQLPGKRDQGEERVSRRQRVVTTVGQASYDELVLSLVTSLSELLCVQMIRLLALKGHAASMLQKEQASSRREDYEAAMQPFLLAVSSDLVDRFHKHLHPVFARSHTGQESGGHAGSGRDLVGRVASTASVEQNTPSDCRGDGRVPSHAVALECLDAICWGRAQMSHSGVAASVVSQLDSVIQELSAWAIEEVFEEMHAAVVQAAADIHTQESEVSGADLSHEHQHYASTSSVELGSSPLPGVFCKALMRAVSQVRSLVAVSDALRRSTMALCVTGIERFLDLLHRLSLCSDLDPLADYWLHVMDMGASGLGDEGCSGGIAGLDKNERFVSVNGQKREDGGGGGNWLRGGLRTHQAEGRVLELVRHHSDCMRVESELQRWLLLAAHALQVDGDGKVGDDEGLENDCVHLARLCRHLRDLMENEYTRALVPAIDCVIENGVPLGDVALLGATGVCAWWEDREEGVDIGKNDGSDAAYSVRSYVDQLLYLLVRALQHFRRSAVDVQERVMKKLVTVLASSLTHHIRREKERYQMLGKAALPASRHLALILDGELVFLIDNLADFTTNAGEKGSVGVAAAGMGHLLSVVRGWLSECGITAAAAAAARRAAIREASFRSGLLIACLSLRI